MTHDEFQRLAASGGPTTPDEGEAVRKHVESCAQCLSVETQVPADAARGAGWWLAIVAIFFLALWIWREAGIRVAREEVRSERAEVIELKDAGSALREQKEKLADELAVISAPGVKIIALAGGPAAPSATGRLYVDAPAHRAVLVATDLAKSGTDSDYELWLYGSDGAPRSGGLFDVTTSHTTIGAGNVPPDLKSATVTLEKNGGAAQPGTTVVLSGRP
jgi:hypothetical protein